MSQFYKGPGGKKNQTENCKTPFLEKTYVCYKLVALWTQIENMERKTELPVIYLYFQENKYTESSGNLVVYHLFGFIWCSFESTETWEKVLCNPCAHNQDGYRHHLYLCSWQSKKLKLVLH